MITQYLKVEWVVPTAGLRNAGTAVSG